MVDAQLAAPAEQRGSERLSPSFSPALPRSLHRLLRLRDLLPAPPFQLGLDVFVDPLLVPPLHGQHRDTIEIDPEMQVVAGGKPRLTRLAEDLALGDGIARVDVDRTEMAVEGEDAEAVIEDHGVAVDAQVAGEGDCAAVGSFDRVVLRN